MQITIHRGIDQIGGCITEIRSNSGTRIIIDLGHNLPNGDVVTEDKFANQEAINTLTTGIKRKIVESDTEVDNIQIRIL